MFKLFRNKKGFSLVELIVVIAILGVISAIAIPTVLNTLKDAKVKADAATCDSLSKSVQLAIVSANSDSSSTNDIATTDGGILSGLGANLAAELLKTNTKYADLKPQSNPTGNFTITITKVDPYEGTVTITDAVEEDEG